MLCLRLRLLRGGIRHFFLEGFPGGFIADKALIISRHLSGGQKACFALWNFDSGLRCVAHNYYSSMVNTGRKYNKYPVPPASNWTILYSLTRVMSLLGNYMSHAPLGVLNVPLVAGNDVNMDMHDALSGRWPYVDANIVAVGAELLVDELFLLA